MLSVRTSALATSLAAASTTSRRPWESTPAASNTEAAAPATVRAARSWAICETFRAPRRAIFFARMFITWKIESDQRMNTRAARTLTASWVSLTLDSSSRADSNLGICVRPSPDWMVVFRRSISAWMLAFPSTPCPMAARASLPTSSCWTLAMSLQTSLNVSGNSRICFSIRSISSVKYSENEVMAQSQPTATSGTSGSRGRSSA